MNRTQKLRTALVNGRELSTAQIVAQFGLDAESVRSTISQFRREGLAVYNNSGKYRVGTPTKAVVAAGYAVLGARG